MEFHNVKLLPKGLPEIIAQLVPYDIYPDTKVIVFPHKGKKFNGHGGSGELGSAGFDDLSAFYCIILYPTMCCSNGGHTLDYPGTRSFQLWMGMLHTALHEIGHLATRKLYKDLPHGDMEYCYEAHRYIEGLADEWMQQAMVRILRVDPRLGQPNGALTGYPGILAYQLRNWGKPFNNGEHNYHRQAEWRGLSCGGQVTINDIAEKLILQEHPGYEVTPESWEKAKARYRRAVHKVAKELGIERYFVNKNGRRYLMFNVGEAEAVYGWLVDNKSVLVDAYRVLKLQQKQPIEPPNWKWELVDGNWDLVGIDSLEKVPPEQMRLPL